MKNSILIFQIALIFTLISCKENVPVVHHSIEGAWRCEEFSPIGGSRIYIVDIYRTKNDTSQYLLSNFFNVDIDESVPAHLSGNTLTISQSSIGMTQIVAKSGSGIVSGNFTRIDFDYNIFDGQNEIKVHAVYSRP